MNPSPHDDSEFGSRRVMYRLAGRTFRYPVYVSIEILWTVIAIYCAARDLILSAAVSPLLMALLVLLALAHSGTLALTRPWIVLRCVALGVGVFAVGYLVVAFVQAAFSPAVLATIVASGYYFWCGEAWTRATAREAIAQDQPRDGR